MASVNINSGLVDWWTNRGNPTHYIKCWSYFSTVSRRILKYLDMLIYFEGFFKLIFNDLNTTLKSFAQNSVFKRACRLYSHHICNFVYNYIRDVST